MSEARFIARLAEALGRPGPAPAAIGDDGAVLHESDGRVVVMDTICQGTHFRLDWSSLADVAYKALAVNVSDIWAMGARPTAWLLSLGLPARAATEVSLAELVDGFSSARETLAPTLELVGGDTIRTPMLTLTVTMLGATIAPLVRSAATPGQTIWVNGPLGFSRAGLDALRRDKHATGPTVDHHRRPCPTWFDPQVAVDAGATAALDISDGLAQDLRRICAASGCGAEIDLPLPGSDVLKQLLGVSAREIDDLQLQGGEDFVHLVTSESRPGPSFSAIGRVVSRDLGLTVIRPDGSRRALPDAGFEHFDG